MDKIVPIFVDHPMYVEQINNAEKCLKVYQKNSPKLTAPMHTQATEEKEHKHNQKEKIKNRTHEIRVSVTSPIQRVLRVRIRDVAQ